MEPSPDDDFKWSDQVVDPEIRAKYLQNRVRILLKEKAATRQYLRELQYAVTEAIDTLSYEEYDELWHIHQKIMVSIQEALYGTYKQKKGSKKK